MKPSATPQVTNEAEFVEFFIMRQYSKNGRVTKAHSTEMERTTDFQCESPLVEDWYLYCTKNHTCLTNGY